MSELRRMVFKLDPNNREAEGQLVERYLTALGYEDAGIWNDERRHDNTRKHIFVDGVKFMYFTDDCHELATIEPIPTPYQVAVAEHMAIAPQELAEYVRGRLPEGELTSSNNPFGYFYIVWEHASEGYDFWRSINSKDWSQAMATDFWRSRTAQSEAPSIEFGKPEHPHEEYDYEKIHAKHMATVDKLLIEIYGIDSVVLFYQMKAMEAMLETCEEDNWDAIGYIQKAKELRDA